MRISILLVVLLLVGCTSTGYMEYEVTRERTTEAPTTQPTLTTKESIKMPVLIDSVSPPTFELSNGDVAMSGGEKQSTDKTMQSITSTSTYVGIGLIVLGIVGIGLRFSWLPMIPTAVPLAAGLSGIGLLFLPVLIDRYAWLIGIAVVGGGATLVAGQLFDWWDWTRLKTPATKKKAAKQSNGEQE